MLRLTYGEATSEAMGEFSSESTRLRLSRTAPAERSLE